MVRVITTVVRSLPDILELPIIIAQPSVSPCAGPHAGSDTEMLAAHWAPWRCGVRVAVAPSFDG